MKRVYKSEITAKNVIVSTIPMIPEDIHERNDVCYVIRSKWLTLLKIKLVLKMLKLWMKYGSNTQLDVEIEPSVLCE